MLKEIRDWAISFLVAVVIILVIRYFLFAQYVVDGSSMENTFHDNERVIVNKFLYNFADLKHSDVIVFDAGHEQAYIKRVIGLPGDTIEMKDGIVYVNGEAIDEPYVKEYENSYRDNFTLETLGVDGDKIPDEQYLVLGDNRAVSKDSREIGLVSEDDIIGKVQLRFWPFSEFTTDFSE
ncbi:signal peptidase I [Phocicoccus pinnipedialis]|uniref:Signal peptidase I n=1 Tax=Phocicoccus pinnipedialis TaxID=110845 RepID=A0A6V7R8K9_9BACL|nr:signal peptidase I [Jeotgalicoccus pinnipedialis]MBP1938895.1 signal peptidase I [Jeotgalicoccus pinnipedialis]CAD2073265.1 Signal peptidase IB [Jeotgalicoccus pinnipedialis]